MLYKCIIYFFFLKFFSRIVGIFANVLELNINNNFQKTTKNVKNIYDSIESNGRLLKNQKFNISVVMYYF